MLANGHLISQTQDATTSYYLADAQGSTHTLTDSSGAILNTYEYAAFGDLVAQTGTTPNDYLYTGQRYDATTEQYYLRARGYDPAVGRFLSRDTWAVDSWNPVELNRYVYAAGNPVTWSDPSGHEIAVDYGEITGIQGVESSAGATVTGSEVAYRIFTTVIRAGAYGVRAAQLAYSFNNRRGQCGTVSQEFLGVLQNVASVVVDKTVDPKMSVIVWIYVSPNEIKHNGKPIADPGLVDPAFHVYVSFQVKVFGKSLSGLYDSGISSWLTLKPGKVADDLVREHDEGFTGVLLKACVQKELGGDIKLSSTFVSDAVHKAKYKWDPLDWPCEHGR